MVIVPRSVMLAEEAARPLLERLDEPRRTAVVLILAGIALVGVLLITCVMIGGSWLRRQARRDLPSAELRNATENQRLRRLLRDVLPEVETSETVSIDRATDETRVDPPNEV